MENGDSGRPAGLLVVGLNPPVVVVGFGMQERRPASLRVPDYRHTLFVRRLNNPKKEKTEREKTFFQMILVLSVHSYQNQSKSGEKIG